MITEDDQRAVELQDCQTDDHFLPSNQSVFQIADAIQKIPFDSDEPLFSLNVAQKKPFRDGPSSLHDVLPNPLSMIDMLAVVFLQRRLCDTVI